MYYLCVQNECEDLQHAADEAGDRHYRAMTDWVTKGRTRSLRDRARHLAEVYRRALLWVIDCYQRGRDSIRNRRKLETAVEFEGMVENDIKILDKYETKTS